MIGVEYSEILNNQLKMGSRCKWSLNLNKTIKNNNCQDILFYKQINLNQLLWLLFSVQINKKIRLCI